MAAIRAEALPIGALLESYRESGAYTDCFVTEVDGAVAHSEYVRAFYTSWLFRVERFILSCMASPHYPKLKGKPEHAGSQETQGWMSDWMNRSRVIDLPMLDKSGPTV